MKNIIKKSVLVFVLVANLTVGTNFAFAFATPSFAERVSVSPSPVVSPVISPVSPIGSAININQGPVSATKTPKSPVSPITPPSQTVTIDAKGGAPSALTVPPNATETSINLQGVFLSGDAQTTTMFEYSTKQSDLPDGQAGNGNIVCQITQPTSATSGPFSCVLSVPTITAGINYYVRAIASNMNGTDYGNTTVIKTIVTSQKPSVLTGVPSATLSSITFNGTFMANGAQTTTMFEYSTNQNDLPSGTAGNGQIACQITQPASSTSGPFSCTLNVPTITAGINYYVRAIASNMNGTDYGNTNVIKTNNNNSCSNPPTISLISPTSALVGSGATNISVTGSNFVSGTSYGEFNGSTRTTSVSSSTSLTIALTASDVSSAGSKIITVTNGPSCNSNSVTFSVNNPSNNGGGGGGGGYNYYPSVYTSNVSGILGNSANLYGTVNPNGRSTTAWFEYGTSSNFTVSYKETEHVNEGSSNSTLNLVQNISGLTPNTTYYFRAVANNSYGTVKGNVLHFTTGNVVNGAITTVQAINITSTSAKLNGIFINKNKAYTQGYFQYGKTPSMTSTTNKYNIGVNPSTVFSGVVNNLTPDTIYYFRAMSVKEGVTYSGKILVFKTSKVYIEKKDTNPNKKEDKPVIVEPVKPVEPVETEPIIITNQSSVIQITNDKEEVSTNDEINYLVTFKNNTVENLENVKISVQLPKEINFQESNFGRITEDNTVILEPEILIPSQVGSMTIKGKINSKTSQQDIIITTAIMSYNIAGSTLEKNEIAYVTNDIIANSVGGLEANPIFGANLLPSTLLEWLILIFAVLGLGFIGRKIYMNYSIKKAVRNVNADHINNLPM